MNITNFQINCYKACHRNFDKTIHLLASQFETNREIIRITYFGSVKEESYADKIKTIRQALSSFYAEENLPLFSYIVQPTAHADEVCAEVIYINDIERNLILRRKKLQEIPYLIVEDDFSSFLLIEGIRNDDFDATSRKFVPDLLHQIESIFDTEGFRIHHIVRQWNYIGYITASTNEIQHYQAFNEMRARFYDKTNWSQGYPAATGIGICMNGLIISLIAYTSKSDSIRIIPIDNPLQVAAHHYSQSKLIGKTIQNLHATPKFERAKIILDKSCGICFVSGTAAIRGEESMHCMKADSQTRQTIENINFLLSETNLKQYGITDFNTMLISIRVYIKHMHDFNLIKSEVDKHWPEIPAIFVQADICRNELLVEIEGIVKLSHLSINTHDT